MLVSLVLIVVGVVLFAHGTITKNDPLFYAGCIFAIAGIVGAGVLLR